MKKNWLKSCDFLNIPTSLSYRNEYFYATNVGAVLTIIFIFIIIILSTYELIILYEKTSFNLISNQYTDLSQILSFEDTPCLFQIINNRGQVIEEDSKLFEIKAYTVEQTIKIDENGKKKNRIVNTELEIEKCDKVYLNEREYFSELNLSKYICVKPGQNLTSYGLLGDMNNAYKGIRIYINKCNGTDCYNDSVIETKLNNAKFIVTYLSFSSNIFNLNSDDLKYQLFTTSSTISTGILKKIFFTFDKGKFDLYNSIIFKNKLSFSYIIANGYSIDVDLDPKSTMKRSDNTISYLSFHYSGNVVETKKEVQNIFSTLSIIGNIINIVLTIFKVINNYYSNKILFVDIFKNIFFAKECMNINLNNYFHFNNNFKTNHNKKINLDISDEIGINNCINKNKNIKPSSKKKMILFSDKNILTKKKSKLYSENERVTNKKFKLLFFYLIPLWYLRKNKSFNNVYYIKDKICGYFSIEKINELIKFKEIIDEKFHKSKMNNTDLIFLHNNNLENNSLILKNNSNSNK